MPHIIQTIDVNILFFIQEHMKSPILDRVMVFVTSLANSGLIWIAIAFILLLQKRYQKCGICLICAIPLATFLGDVLLKPLFHRVRPCNLYPEIPLLLPGPHTYSFPSGHTMQSFAAATVIFYYHPRLGILAYLLASVISFSRLYLFVHFPSDVLGGMCFGILGSVILICGINKLYRLIDTTVPD